MEQIVENDYSLSIPLYFSDNQIESTSIVEIEECITDWFQSSAIMHEQLMVLNELLEDESGEDNA